MSERGDLTPMHTQETKLGKRKGRTLKTKGAQLQTRSSSTKPSQSRQWWTIYNFGILDQHNLKTLLRE